MDTESLSFGDWLLAVMKEKGVSRAELARRIGVDRGTVSNWINNKRRPEAESCERIAVALEQPVNDVLVRAGRIRQRPQPLTAYEVERTLRDLQRLGAEQEVELKRLAQLSRAWDQVHVRDRGRLPADTIRWVSEEVQMESVPTWMLRGRSPERVFIAEASGDCLLARGIADGDLVFLEELPAGQEPRNGDVVAVRFYDEVTLKIWQRTGDWIELRDGNGALLHRFSIFDDYTVEGVVFARFGETD